MLRTARIARPWALTLRASYSSAPSPAAPARASPAPHPPAPLPTDELCIPLAAPYDLSDYLPAPGQSPSLDRDTLLKLHRLAALEPPSTEQGWADLADLDELVAIVQAVRHVDTSALGLEPGAMVDALVRADPLPVDWTSTAADSHQTETDPPEASGQALLRLAQRTEGAYYVAPMPDNVPTRKRSSSSDESGGSEDEY